MTTWLFPFPRNDIILNEKGLIVEMQGDVYPGGYHASINKFVKPDISSALSSSLSRLVS